MGVRMSTEGEARVVRDVQPLVAVDGPGVGALRTAGEVAEPGARRRPEAERTVEMEPRTRFRGRVGDRVEIVEGAGIHLACLAADDRRPVAEPQFLHPPASLVLDGD